MVVETSVHSQLTRLLGRESFIKNVLSLNSLWKYVASLRCMCLVPSRGSTSDKKNVSPKYVLCRRIVSLKLEVSYTLNKFSILYGSQTFVSNFVQNPSLYLTPQNIHMIGPTFKTT